MFTGDNTDMNGLWTLAMDTDGTPLANDGFPYYGHLRNVSYCEKNASLIIYLNILR